MAWLYGLYGRFIPFLGVILLALILNTVDVFSQQNAYCDQANPCKVGCCSSSGACGFTENHCGEGCISNCNATAECGEFALEESFDCPINVCCSKFGFCGITEEFCGDGCQENSDDRGCGSVSAPKTCEVNTDALTYERRIAYYELFTRDRPCGVKEPEDLPLGPVTHLNLAFILFGSDFKLKYEHDDWVKRTVLRKLKYPSLRINLAIGGWVFNDPPTSTYFSDMVQSYEGRATFIDSVVEYIRYYGLDGVDVDWEYPVATDRGGDPGDFSAFVQMMAELRDAFEEEGSGWEISATLPTSYWYLRGFNLEYLQRQVDYFNLMSYDIHGMWDFDNEFTGPYLKGHTDWSQIDQGLDLLWRNNIRPEKVVMGFGFYGRSFTMVDSGCHEPNGVCEFATGGTPGTCSGEAGILTFEEITSRNKTLDASTYYDVETTVKYTVFGGDQWISYDDSQSFHDKLARLSERCLGGLMIWAIDQDTPNFTALSQLLGDYSDLELDGINSDSAENLHDMFGQFTGQDCFVTPRCTDGSDGEQGEQQVCPSGYMTVDTAHNPQQTNPHPLYGSCAEGWYRRICCPKESMPKNCEWIGAPERQVIGCSGECGEGTFELNRDTALDAEGHGQCFYGTRKLCCQGTKLIEDCFWGTCQGPLSPSENPECPEGSVYQTWRYNKPEGTGLCREEYVSPIDGSKGSPLKEPFRSPLCCPEGREFNNCNWANSPEPPPPLQWGVPELYCLPQPCKQDQIEIADALDPPRSPLLDGTFPMSCDGVSLPPSYDPHFGFCCDPPSTWNKDWPVDPEKLWEVNFNNPETDKALWEYKDNYNQNDKDSERSNKEYGSDAYGFMMLNGKEEALDDEFGSTYSVVRQTAEIPKVKREIVTTNHTAIENVFEHAEETFFVYCNHPAGSDKCNAVWKDGVEDTIIRLPDHVGEGPFARVVTMELADEGMKLPRHHLEHRALDGVGDNPVYKVKIDYDFHLIREERGPVQIRVDYTNLLEYWDELTDEKAKRSSRIKRGIPEDEPFTMGYFRNRVKRAQEAEKKLAKRNTHTVRAKMPLELTPVDQDLDEAPHDLVERDGNIGKRWWGIFKDWLKKLTTVRDGEKGDLPLDWADEINIFKAKWGCPGKTWSANLRLDLQADLTMQAQYAYYYSGTFIPPSKPDVFFYFGIEPEAAVMLKLTGNAEMRYQSQRKKIIDTIGYPGLAVKGIAAVGPTLDIYGQVKGYVNVHGEAKAGATVNFGKSQAYWPQGDAAIGEYDDYLDLDLKEDPEKPPKTEVAPTFEAGVQVKAGLDVIVQPEANVGIKVGGSKWTGGVALVDAQVTAFMRGILQFFAAGSITTNTQAFDYKYGAYFYYNLGYKAKAQILEWVEWALGERSAYEEDKQVTIYESKGTIPLTSNEKRMVKLIDPVEDEGEEESLSSRNGTTNAEALLDPSYLFRRADDGDSNLDPNKPKFTNKVACPSGSSADIKLPNLRFNCGAFPPLQVTNTDGSYSTLDGLCKGYKTVSGLPMTLTHSPPQPDDKEQKKWLDKKRSLQCPSTNGKGYCEAKTSQLHGAVGYDGSLMKLECDEYPWASSEEGGDFKDSSSRSQLCVPSVQNGLGGGCIAILSYIQQNVGKMEPSIEKLEDRDDAWVYWGGSGGSDMDFWFTEGNTKGSATQRFTKYPNKQPIPVGFTNLNRSPGTESWTFKRNYTFSIVDSGTQASAWWDATDKAFQKKYTFKNPTAGDYSSVICAVNTFGQDTYYKDPKQGKSPNFNGLCFTNKRTTKNGWEDQNVFSRCRVDFGSTVTKRSTEDTLEAIDDWDIQGVTVFDDELDATDPDALSKLMEKEGREQADGEAGATAQVQNKQSETREISHEKNDTSEYLIKEALSLKDRVAADSKDAP